jgi:tetratricopeptide (TPR) repeat protein
VLWAQQFTWNEEIRDAYSLLLDLRFKQADSTLKILAIREPKNLCVPYLQDLSDFLFIVVSEDRKEFDRRELFREKRLKALESAAVSDPFRNVALGEHQLHWAFSNMRFGNYLNGAMGIRKAFQLLEDNTHRFPNLLHTYKSMGLLHTLVGTVPDNYQWATKLMGVNGSITQGMSEMQRVIKGTSGRPEFGLVQKETLFLFTFLQINLVNDDAALKNIDRYLAKQSGPLMDFAKARILQKNGRTDEAIALLETSLISRPYVFPYLQFLLGEMKLSRMDADANKALDIYLRIFKGNSYMKAAYHKLAWHALLVQRDQKSYFSYLTKISNVGSTMVDEDRAAQQESEVRKLPNVHLLRARIMFDGGYYTKAIESLENAPQSSFISQDEKLELSYRMGRLRHEMGDHKKAIEHYETTCKNGATSTRYFAANASLQLGLLYEKLGEKEKARKYFQACSTFKNTEYRDSINQKAKAGLLRL